MAFTPTQHHSLTGEDIHALTRWTVADSAARLALSLVSTDNDKICKQLDNNSYWILADWTGPTWVETTSVGVAAVTSVFGEIGDVDETDANFTASQIANAAAGDIEATDVQAALNELDADKAPATHTHVLSQITDSGTAAAEDIGVLVGDIPQLEDRGDGTPSLPAVDGSQLTGVAAGASTFISLTDVNEPDYVGHSGQYVKVNALADGLDFGTPAGAGDVTAASNIVADNIVLGDDGAKGIKDSGVAISDKADTTDTRFPTANEKGALAGTGAPSGSNRYVVDNDSRVVNAVQGPASATANAIARFDQATGKLVKNSIITLDDGDPNQSVMSWNNGPDSTVISSTTINCENVIVGAALRTEADHVQYGVAAPTVVDQANRGIWWVEDQTTTTKPHFREGDGTDHNLLTPEGANILATGVTDTTLALKPDGAGGAEWAAETGGGGGSALTVEDDGTPLTTNATKLNFAGAVVVTEPVADEITITVTPGSAPVASVFTRTGAVLAEASDYNASQIDNDATNANGNVTGAFVSSALDTADVAIEANTTATTAAQADADAAQSDATAAKAKTDFLTVTGSVNLDTVLSETTANTLKRSYPVADEALVDGHETTLANVATPITTAGAALLDDADNIEQRTTLGLGSAALGTVGVTIGDIVELVNVGGNPGFPALRGDNLVGIPTGAEVFLDLTDVTEPDYVGHAGQFVKVNAGATGLEFDTVPGGGDLLSTNNLSDVTNAITATQNLSVEVGVDVAAFGHTHDVLSNVDNTAGNGVILGRDTAGSGDSEELTPAEARAVIDVTIDNIGAGTHSQLEAAVADAGAIFCSSIAGNNQITGLTADASPAVDDVVMVEDAVSGAKVKVELQNLPDNSTDVTLAGTPDYITISGQVITRNAVDLTADVTGDLPVADGGTGASDAGTARTNLGVAPIEGATAPGDSTGNGRIVGTTYVDTTADRSYILVDATTDTNVWLRTDINTIDAGAVTTGTFDSARISEASVTLHEGAIDHDALANVDDTQTNDRHRIILHDTTGSPITAAAAGSGAYHQFTDSPYTFEYSDGATWHGVTSGTGVNPDGTTAQDAALFTERADHVNTPAAGKAELWVSNDATQKLYFTNDAGTDVDLTAAGGGGPTTPGTTVVPEVVVWDATDGSAIGRTGFLMHAASAGTGTRDLGTSDIGALAGGEIVTDGTIEATDDGAVAMGFVSQASTGACKISATADGAVALGAASSTDTNTSTVEATGAGALAVGEASYGTVSSQGAGSLAVGTVATGGTVKATANGCLAVGLASGAVGELSSSNLGAFAGGYALGGTVKAAESGALAYGYATTGNDILSNGSGSVCLGYASGTDITASANGSFAGGYSNAASGVGIVAAGAGSIAYGSNVGAGEVDAEGIASVALGYALNTDVRATGSGSVALGYSSGSDIHANANGCMQLGPGTNAVANSLQCGNTTNGVRLQSGGTTSTVAGSIWSDGTDTFIRSGAANRNMSDIAAAPTLSKSITIPDPVTLEDITIFHTPVAITITEINAVIRGTTPSVLWFIKHATMTTGRDSAGTAVVTAGTTTTDQGGVSITSFDDATIPADSFLWLETTTVSGTNDELALTIVYTED